MSALDKPVVDNLESFLTNYPLSANQGRILSDEVLRRSIQDGVIAAEETLLIKDGNLLERTYIPISIDGLKALLGVINQAEEALELVINVEAFEDLLDGDFVHVFRDGTILKGRRSIANTSRFYASGFIKQNWTQGEIAKVFLLGLNSHLSGIIPDDIYILSDLNFGKAINTDISDPRTDKISQRLGRGINSTTIFFERSDPIILA